MATLWSNPRDNVNQDSYNEKMPVAILLDCDDTLVESEVLARGSTVELRAALGARFQIPWPTDSGGLNMRSTVQLMAQKHGLVVTEEVIQELVAKEEEVVINALEQQLQPCSGIKDVLDVLILAQPATGTKAELAVVSSSSGERLRVSLNKTGLHKYFAPDRVFSAVSSLVRPTGKPDPAIYLHACKVMGVDPAKCLAIEDSVSGVTSAKAAGIPVWGYTGCLAGANAEAMKQRLIEAGAAVVLGHWNEFWAAWTAAAYKPAKES